MSTSIPEQILELENSGKLRRFNPVSRRPAKRRAFLTVAAQQDYDNLESAVNRTCGQGYIKAALTRWTTGEYVYAGFLKPLKAPPPEVWEIRVTDPTPQARLIGRFADCDTIVLTKFYTREHLGKFGSANWVSAMGNCCQSWKLLFGSTSPYTGKSISDYVSGNCHEINI
jgi:hypothetical protein